LSQFKHIQTRMTHGFLTSVALGVSSLSGSVSYATLGGVLALTSANPALAASYTPRATPVTPTKYYKINLGEHAKSDKLVLDWRNESQELKFEIPENHWVDDIELVISADPVGGISSRKPLNFKLNTGKVTAVKPQGRAFDARINLSTRYIRTGTNKISISLPKSAYTDCLNPFDGHWDIDLKNSFIVVKTRQRTRHKYLRQVNQTLSSNAFAPKSVALLARGENTLKLQALAAQAVSMRMSEIPNFRLHKGGSDLEIIAAKRSELANLVIDKDILSDRGPRLYVDEGQKMRLVITGDNDAQLLEMMQAFSSYKLPNVRRSKVSLGELVLHDAFADINKAANGTQRLADLGVTDFDDNWSPRAQSLTFNVDDPLASSATLRLDLGQTTNIEPSSTLSVNLNGQDLGKTRLNKKRKSVVFDIPKHSLRGRDNVLKLIPSLEMKSTQEACAHTYQSHGLNIKPSSTLKMDKIAASPVTELSRLTASGSVFSDKLGQDSRIILSARSSQDMAASFKVLGQLAKSSGKSWANAQYLRISDPKATSSDKHVMLIGPNSAALKRYISTAPKSLFSGIKGQAIAGTIPKKSASLPVIDPTKYTKLAYNSADISSRSYKKTRLTSSGLAAIYASDNKAGKLTGVITTTPGRSFSQSVDQLITPQSWNRLSGSVARWNQSTVLMAQVSQPVPGFTSPLATTPKAFTSLNLADFNFEAFTLANMVNALDAGYFSVQDKVTKKWAEMTGLKPEVFTHPSNGLRRSVPKTSEDKQLNVVPRLRPAKDTPVSAQTFTARIGSFWANLQNRAQTKATPNDRLAQPVTAAPTPIVKTAPNAVKSLNSQADPVAKLVLRGSVKPGFAKSAKVDWNAVKTKISDPKKWSSLSLYDFALDDDFAAIKRKSVALSASFSEKFKGSKLLGHSGQDVKWAGQTVSQSGLLLVWIFIFIFILLSLISPASRANKQ